MAALADSAEWVAYLRFGSAFRRYSVDNLLLIAAQCPHAIRVAGYRKVARARPADAPGERAIKILGYSTKKTTATDPVIGEEVEDRVVRYRVLSVFDHRGLCETEAESTAYVMVQLLGLDTDASSISYIAGWSRADPAAIAAAAANVLRAVNTIAAGFGLDDQDDDATGEQTAA